MLGIAFYLHINLHLVLQIYFRANMTKLVYHNALGSLCLPCHVLVLVHTVHVHPLCLAPIQAEMFLLIGLHCLLLKVAIQTIESIAKRYFLKSVITGYFYWPSTYSLHQLRSKDISFNLDFILFAKHIP